MHLGLLVGFLLLACINGTSCEVIKGDHTLWAEGKGECITGGKEIKKYAYPFMVRLAIAFETGQFALCGGSLISSEWVLTAAHCVDFKDHKVANITVYLGTHNFYLKELMEQAVEATQVVVHSEYIEKEQNDIALVKMKTKPKLTKAVRVGCLSPRDNMYIGVNAKVIGWGTTSLDHCSPSYVLKETDVPILPGSNCFINDTVDQDKMCTGFPNKIAQNTVFMGDSGGPLFVVKPYHQSPTIVGIASVVSTFPFFKHPVLYSIFTRVSHYIDWIQTFVKEDEMCISSEHVYLIRMPMN